MALLSLVFIAIFAVTAVLMIAANEQQTQMTLNAALHMRDDGNAEEISVCWHTMIFLPTK